MKYAAYTRIEPVSTLHRWPTIKSASINRFLRLDWKLSRTDRIPGDQLVIDSALKHRVQTLDRRPLHRRRLPLRFTNEGGKRLGDRLIPLFLPHECYVEVFSGGTVLYFMQPQAAPTEVLNDINDDLVTLYRVVQNHLEECVRQFKWALSSRQVFEWQKIARPETLTDIQRAARFFLPAASCLCR